MQQLYVHIFQALFYSFVTKSLDIIHLQHIFLLSSVTRTRSIKAAAGLFSGLPYNCVHGNFLLQFVLTPKG